jgi:Leucine-rich repeat (LRR) protein
VKQGAFRGLGKLETLNLGVNGLSTLPDGIFSDLKKLQQLDLSFNKFTQISSGLMAGLGPSLTRINLQYNMITSVSARAFHGLSGLVWLSMSSNKLAMLPFDVFANLSKASIRLGSNPLLCLPRGALADVQALPPCPLEVCFKICFCVHFVEADFIFIACRPPYASHLVFLWILVVC